MTSVQSAAEPLLTQPRLQIVHSSVRACFYELHGLAQCCPWTFLQAGWRVLAETAGQIDVDGKHSFGRLRQGRPGAYGTAFWFYRISRISVSLCTGACDRSHA